MKIKHKPNFIRKSSIVVLISVTLLSSGCSNESFPDSPCNDPETVSRTIRELTDFNIRIGNLTRGELHDGWENKVSIPLSDARGAFEGARLGINAAALLPGVTHSVGATAGGALIGATSSFDCYRGASAHLNGLSCHDTADAESQSSGSPSIPTDIDVEEVYFDAAYAYSKGQIVENDYALGLSCGSVSRDCIRIGILHNHMLGYLSRILAGMNPETYHTFLTQEEKELLDSEFFIDGRSKIRRACGNPVQTAVTEADIVMNLFSDAVLNSVSGSDDLDAIIKQYISTVSKSRDLTDNDKEALCSGFIVMAYSYQFWTPILR